MDELLANLGTDAPLFEPAAAFADHDHGFVAVFNHDGSAAPSPGIPIQSPGLQLSSAGIQLQSPGVLPGHDSPGGMDYLATEPDLRQLGRGQDLDAFAPQGSDLGLEDVKNLGGLKDDITVTDMVQEDVGPAVVERPITPPLLRARRRFRPIANTIVADAWKRAVMPAEFVSAVRAGLPAEDTTGGNVVKTEEDSMDVTGLGVGSNSAALGIGSPVASGSGGGVASEASGKAKVAGGGESTVRLNLLNAVMSWQLTPGPEGAILDALFARLTSAEAASTRLMGYLQHALVTGLVSQRAVVSTCLNCTAANPDISDRVLQALARFLAHIIPFYSFSATGDDLTTEATEYLAAFTMIMQCVAKTPTCAPDLAAILANDRVVALVRACARRVPTSWVAIDAAIAEMESTHQASNGTDAVLPSPTAFSVVPELRRSIARLKRGLSVGITTLEAIATSAGNIEVPPPGSSLPDALQTAINVTVHVFGNDIAKALRALWMPVERLGGDVGLLVALERATSAPKQPQGNQQPSQTLKYGFQDRVRACEAIVRFLAERASVPGAADPWIAEWGGKERLGRILRDAVPQVKAELRSESGALMVAMAVSCCAAMCLGPSLRLNEPNDGLLSSDPADIANRITMDEEIEDTMGELSGFAVGCLEEAAMAEEMPTWRSFGLWLLLLNSRCGAMLRSSGCEHARAARVLRAWGGMRTGTPGSHAVSSAHKQGGQGASGQASQGSSTSSSSMTEGVAKFAAPASLAIIDVSDISGSDATIRALCDDLIQ